MKLLEARSLTLIRFAPWGKNKPCVRMLKESQVATHIEGKPLPYVDDEPYMSVESAIRRRFGQPPFSGLFVSRRTTIFFVDRPWRRLLCVGECEH